jgi:hypothetical protein
MMSMQRQLWWFVAATAVLLGTGCSPVPEQEASTARPDVADKPAVEKIQMLPQPTPAEPADRIEAAILHVRDREMLTTNSFWTVFHGILGLGPAATLRDPQTNERVNALDFVCNGGEVRGLQFLPTRYGLDVRTGPQMVGQGHQDQFIAEMAQWGMPAGRTFVVLGKDYTFMDFVRHCQMRARVTSNQELSWAIVVIGQYVGTDAAWTNGAGEKLRFEDLVRYELAAPVEDAACGGTHRLFGLSWVHRLHLARGGKTEGVWKEVVQQTAKYRDLAQRWQNPDGCFSTQFFRGGGDAPDKQLRINTTGHTLEWLALALSDEELRQPWVQNAASALALTILDLQNAPIEGGSLYHATHGLLLYRARVRGTSLPGLSRPIIP